MFKALSFEWISEEEDLHFGFSPLPSEASNRWRGTRGVSSSANLRAHRKVIPSSSQQAFSVWGERKSQRRERSRRDSDVNWSCLSAVPFQEIQGTILGRDGGGWGVESGKLLPLRLSSTGIFDSLLLSETSRCPAPISGTTLPERALNSCCRGLQPRQAWAHSESNPGPFKEVNANQRMTGEERNGSRRAEHSRSSKGWGRMCPSLNRARNHWSKRGVGRISSSTEKKARPNGHVKANNPHDAEL